MNLRPFRIADADITDLHARLDRMRLACWRMR